MAMVQHVIQYKFVFQAAIVYSSTVAAKRKQENAAAGESNLKRKFSRECCGGFFPRPEKGS